MRRITMMVLCIFCCISLMMVCQKAEKEPTYSMTEPYQYPIVPGMEEWSELASLQEMIEVCQIPDDILANMTTEALVETVVNYPLFINVFAYDNRQLGLEHVKGYFNGLQELYARDDAIEKIEIHIVEKLPYSEDADSTKSKAWYAELILEDLQSD